MFRTTEKEKLRQQADALERFVGKINEAINSIQGIDRQHQSQVEKLGNDWESQSRDKFEQVSQEAIHHKYKGIGLGNELIYTIYEEARLLREKAGEIERREIGNGQNKY